MEALYYANIFNTILFFIIFGIPFFIAIKILMECNKAIIDDKNKDVITRKKNVQKIARFIKNFSKNTVFGNYVIENDNIIIEVRQDIDKTQYLCKDKNFTNGKMQILIFYQKKKNKSSKPQNYFEWAYPQSEIFEDICNNFDEKTDIKKIKELLDMGNTSFEEKFINI